MDGELKHQMLLLKLAHMCNPIRLREVRPTPEQLAELSLFKILQLPDLPISIQGLKDKLSHLLQILMLKILALKAFFHFPKPQYRNSKLGQVCISISHKQISSAPVESFFVYFYYNFQRTQETLLSNYVEAVVIKCRRYNVNKSM